MENYVHLPQKTTAAVTICENSARLELRWSCPVELLLEEEKELIE
jgi:hypothetical protein